MFQTIILILYIILLTIIILLYYKNRGYKNRITSQVMGAILTPDELEKHSVEVALNHKVNRKARSCSNLQHRLEENYKYIIKAYKELNKDAVMGRNTAPAAEWLFDNFYIIEEQVKDIRRNFPSGAHSVLPCLKSGLLKGFPRIYDIAIELIVHTDGRIDEKLLNSFLKAYQSKSQLTGAELWALPVMLKVALIENIRHICDELIKSQQDKRRAEEIADSILSSCGNPENSEEEIRFFTKDMETLSPSFAEQLLMRIKRHGCDIGPVMHYIDERLASQDTNAEEIIQIEHQQQAKNQVSIGNSITSMRLISSMDWHIMFENLSPVEQALRSDPAGVYMLMDFASRDYYRHGVEYIAKRLNISEAQVAKKAVECAAMADDTGDVRLKHVGYYITGRGRKKLESVLGYHGGILIRISRFVRNYPTAVYLIPIIILSVAISSVFEVYMIRHGGGLGAAIVVFLVCLLPASEIALGIVNWVITHALSPAFLPKYEYMDKIPEEYAAMVVIPALITNKSRVKQLMDELEIYYLANPQKNIFFALLGDFADAGSKDMLCDKEIVDCGLKCASELNKKYGGKDNELFFFFQRYRKYNPSQGVWMGWERKRGKLMEFNKLLRGEEDTSYYIKSGDISKLPLIKYVITLDADTELPRDAAKRLIGTMSHPMNRAVMDQESSKIINGYGILQPRVSIDVINANKSAFSKIFAGQGGIDPYTTAVSDVYMDLFGEGIYTGKGIYDVDIFIKALEGHIPENTVLSHDLLEGAYVRAGLVTDIELVDGFPAKYSSYAARLHRWVRGDWQLLPWLKVWTKDDKGSTIRNNLSAISKWKILDNLRRSLMPLALMLLVFLSIVFLPGNEWVWIGLAVLTVAFPVFTGVADALLVSGDRSEYRNIDGVKNILLQILLLFIFLPYKAYLMADAIIRTLYRLCFSKKKLLEWETAADAEVRLKNSVESYIKSMWVGPVSAVVMVVVCSIYAPNLIGSIILTSILWIMSPIVAYYVSKVQDMQSYRLTDEDISELRVIARKTWRYFDEFVGAKDNFLPPDNYQLDPPNGAAHRTSPTNIGLYLVSAMAARDMGYISTGVMVEKLGRTFDSMDKLDRWRGHFYNWYDNITMQPLKPLYVSTVDSGNLVGYLMTLKQGLVEYADRPLIEHTSAMGLMDIILMYNAELKNEKLNYSILEKICYENEVDLVLWDDALDEITKSKGELEWSSKPDCPYSKMIDEAISMYKSELSSFFPWVELMKHIPEEIESGNDKYPSELSEMIVKLKAGMSANELSLCYHDGMSLLNDIIEKALGDSEAVRWLKELKTCFVNAYLNLNKLLSTMKQIRERAEKIIENTDFVSLFDMRRQLFSIGYSVEEEQLNRSYYDLLASESRQTSFIAIANGQIDQKHWFRLGRSLTEYEGSRGLVSWSGTMFEYLMPLLIMKNYDNTLLSNTYSFAVKSQIGYGKMRNVPWGVSESGFAAFDMALNYQYKAFGVPRLGLKRGLVNDMVIAPYATILALMVDTNASLINLRSLKSENLEGPYGFYEACDYTLGRVPAGKKNVIVKSFMVHHHGMSMLALDNVINNNIMQQRFHKNPEVEATELLLQEKVPNRVTLTKDIEDEATPEVKEKEDVDEFIKDIEGTVSVFPEAHILSNGNLHTVLTDSGNGFSRLGSTSITRWRENNISASQGMFIYVQNTNSNNLWSAAYEPCRVEPERYRVIFSSDKVEYQRTDGNIDTHTEVVISPEDNVEIRRVSLTNHSSHSRVIEVTSYFEAVISSQGADAAHPAFNNLFVRTEYDQGSGALYASRRPREAKQKLVWLMHKTVVEGDAVGAVQYETDRMKFVGRGRDLSDPEALDADHPLSNTTGAVLDPVMSIRRRVKIRSGETAIVSFIIGAAESKADTIKLSEKYSDGPAVKRVFELAWTRSQVEARYLGLKSRDIEFYQSALAHILYISPLRKNRGEIIRRNTKGQSGLWPLGISGDLPIVLVSVKRDDELDLVEYMLKAHEYWRMKGLLVDLVILNEDSGDYMQTSANKIRNMILSSHGAELQDRSGGVFLRQSGSISEDSINLLYAAARIVFDGESGSLKQQIRIEAEEDGPAMECRTVPRTLHIPVGAEYSVSPEKLQYWNGIGGFDKSGSEYVIYLEDGNNTPAPWSNVVCNEKFGFLVTSSGGGYTWSENSREFKISPWSNDPVTDTPGEIVYLNDLEENIPWSITPLPIREKEPYIIRHGFGYSAFEHISRGLKQEMTVFTPSDEKVKLIKVKLKNISSINRRLSVTYYVKPVLGVSDQITSPFIDTDIDKSTGILLINNRYSDNPFLNTVFIGCSEKSFSFTGDAAEFFGSRGSIHTPEGICKNNLSGNVGAGFNPCAAVMANIELKPNEEKIIVFTLGKAEDDRELSTAVKYRDIYAAEGALRETRGFWNKLLGTIQVKTPDESMNILMNGWLMYQTICCRMWARSAFYQSGGAYGFRDQLQDSMAAAYVLPELTKKQIVLHSSHQYLEGDVQHWWHPVTDKGIRTKFSDDLLWLPYVTADYINTTGDNSILDIVSPYLEDTLLGDEEDERYNTPNISTEQGTIYEHCIRSIDRALKFGEHGIPLMGSGDWNDGMNTVGNKGRGESIWLGWFLNKILTDFAPICSMKGESDRANGYIKAADGIREAIEKYGWDGSWYRRAYFDDGKPLGSASNSECRIDSIAQSWSVISRAGREKRVEEAMRALNRHLISRDAGLIMLLSPPFDRGDTEPGYIKGYVPGVRENGGQYTHAAIWVILAYAMMGQGTSAGELFRMINPINHTSTAMECARYKVEPYVLAADVYAIEPHTGRGGWTWYTGAAGWMYRVCIEHMLGIKLNGEKITINPCVPEKWPEYTVRYKYMDTVYTIKIKNTSGTGSGVTSVNLDSRLLSGIEIPLVNDRKEHMVEVVI